MTYYTKDGRKLTDTEADEIRAANQKIFEEAENSGDISKLLNIEWLFSEEVIKATEGEKNYV